ncbi:MAG: 30S ribosomal protein S6 [Rickettsiales bacterium]|nr:30S ribosomal protein S6 [Rickettsiales bacterium]
MAQYECTFIARHDMSRNDVQKLTDEFAAVIKDNGGSVVKEEYWGLRNLAYKINKNGKGHYTMLGLDTPYPALAEMERQMRLNEDVVRVLTVKVETMDSSPSVMMKHRGGDSDSEAA